MVSVKQKVEAIGGANILRHSSTLRDEKYLRGRLALLQELKIELRERQKLSPEFEEYLALHLGFIECCLQRLGNNNTLINLSGQWSSLSAYRVANSARSIREYLGLSRSPASFMDAASLMAVRGQCERRMQYLSQRIANAIRFYTKIPNNRDTVSAHGWFLVFDTLTFDDHNLNGVLECFRTAAPERKHLPKGFRKPPIQEYMRKIGAVVTPEGEKQLDWHQYVCVPELGTKNGRFHYHILHFFRDLPSDWCFDPNQGLPAASMTRKRIKGLESLWRFGQSQAIACRYKGDAFGGTLGWFNPRKECDRTGESYPEEMGSPYRISGYLAGYMSEAAEEHYKRSIINPDGSRYESVYPDTMMRYSSSRGFGMSLPSMVNLSDEGLLSLTNLSSDVSPFHLVIREVAKRQLSNQISDLDFKSYVDLRPTDKDYLRAVRCSFGQTNNATEADKQLLLRPCNGLADLQSDALEWVVGSALDFQSLQDEDVKLVGGVK